jgi:hypothetical protein
MAIKLDFTPVRLPIASPKNLSSGQSHIRFQSVENNPEASPLYFGAKQYQRTVLTAEERTQRAQAEKLAATQWGKMPLLFQVGYEKPGQKISSGKMAALKSRLNNLPQLSQHPAVREALEASFSPSAPASALVKRERLALDQISLILDMVRDDSFRHNFSSAYNKTAIEMMQAIQDPDLREGLIIQMATNTSTAARVFGAKVLGLLSNPEQQQTLARQLLDDTDEYVQVSAIPAIALFPTERQKIELIKEIAQKPGWWGHVWELANVIRSLKDQTAKRNLILELGRSDSIVARRTAAKSAEGNLPQSPETDAMFERLAQDPSPEVREEAIRSAHRTDDNNQKSVSDKTWEHIVLHGLDDDVPAIRKIASFYISDLSDEKARLKIAKNLMNNGSLAGTKVLESLSDQEKAALFRNYVKHLDSDGNWLDAREFLGTIKDERIRMDAYRPFFAYKSTYTINLLLFKAIQNVHNERLRADTLKTAIDMRARQLPPDLYKPMKTYKTEDVSLAPLIAKFENPALRTELMEFILKHPVPVVRAEALSDDLFLPEFQDKIAATLKNDPSPLVRAQLQRQAPELYSPQVRQETLRELSKEKNHVEALYEAVRQVSESRDAKLQDEILPDAFTRLIDTYINKQGSSYNFERKHLLKKLLPDIVDSKLQQHFQELLTADYETPSYEQSESLIKQIKETDDITQKTELLKQWMHFCLEQGQNQIPDIIQADILPSLNNFLEEVPYTQIVNQALPQLQAVMNEALAEQLRNGKAKDKTFLHQAVPLLSQPGALSAGQLTGTLQTISALNLDTRVLPQALAELARFRLHALKAKAQFAPHGRTPMTDEALKQYLDAKTDIILQGILIAGDGVLLDKFDQRQERFELFLEALARILQDEDVTQRLYQIKRLPDRHGKQDAYQKTKLIEYCYGFLMLNQKEALLPFLDGMIQQGTRDLSNLGTGLVQALALKADMPSLQAQTLTEEQLKLFNPDYLHTIPLAIRNADQNAYGNENLEQLKTLIKATLQGTYKALLHDANTDSGRVNLETRHKFEQFGLNYDLWLQYPKTHTFQMMVDGKPHEMEVKLWDRKPGYDIFQGNYTQACTAMGGPNGRALIDALMHTCVQMVEVRDKTADKTVSKVQTLWIKDEQSGKPVLLADNIQSVSPYRETDGMLDGIRPFMQTFANDVAGQATPVAMGQNANKVTQLDELSAKLLNVRVIGDTPDHKMYLSAYPQDGNALWRDILKQRNIKLFQL